MQFNDDGFFDIKLRDGEPVRVDLFRCNNRIYEVQQKHAENRGPAYEDELIALIVSWGVPAPITFKLALDIADALWAEVQRLQKKTGPGAPPSGSPS